MKNKIKFTKININKGYHFLASYREDIQLDESVDIAVFTYNENHKCVNLNLITHDICYENALSLVKNKINYYIFELQNTCPASYLAYHCNSISNAYDTVYFSYIPQITNTYLTYYIKTSSKIENISNNNFIIELEKVYAGLQLKLLLNNACFMPSLQFDEILSYFSDIYFDKLPIADGLEHVEPKTIVEFTHYLNKLTSRDFCQIINYFKYRKLIKPSETENLIKMFLLNKHHHQNT